MIELPDEPEDQLKVLYGLFFIRNRKKEFAPMTDWMLSEFNRLSLENMTTTGIQLYRRQGALQLLDKLINLVRESGDLIDILDREVRKSI